MDRFSKRDVRRGIDGDDPLDLLHVLGIEIRDALRLVGRRHQIDKDLVGEGETRQDL
jgi:hypothetical protein